MDKERLDFPHLYRDTRLHERNCSKSLTRETNTAPDVRLDIHARGFLPRQSSAFFDVRECRPNEDLTKTLPLSKYTARMKTRRNASMQAEVWRYSKSRWHRWCSAQHRGIAPEFHAYHRRLAELPSAEKGDDYSTTMTFRTLDSDFFFPFNYLIISKFLISEVYKMIFLKVEEGRKERKTKQEIVQFFFL